MHHLQNVASKSTNVIYESAIVMRKSGNVMRKFRKPMNGLLKINHDFANLMPLWLMVIRSGLKVGRRWVKRKRA